MSGITVLKDNPARLRPEAQAKVVKPGEDLTNLRAPSNAAVIGRAAADVEIAVQRQEGDGIVCSATESTFVQKEAVAQVAANSDIVYAERKEAADAVGIENMGVTVAACEEHGVGVQPVQRQTTNLGDPIPARKQEETIAVEVKHVEATPTTPVAIAPPLRQPTPSTVTPVPVPVHTTKVPVTLSSPNMGRHRIKVPQVSVSDTLVVIAYDDSEDAVIVEPPIADDITVEYDGNKYKCAYRGFTSQMTFGSTPMLLVVLIRLNG